MVTKLAFALDALLLAFAFGATAWFFFVQTPALLRGMKKEKFVPLQMRLTRVLFKTLAVVVPLMFATTLVHGHDNLWLHVATAGLAMLGALANAFIAVPRALRAGGKALRETRSEETSLGDFTSRGAGDASKVWHRVVVAFVLVMVGGLISHGAVLLHTAGPVLGEEHHVSHDIGHSHDGSAAAVHAHDQHDEAGQGESMGHGPWKADASTNAHIESMKKIAAQARVSGDVDSAATQLRATYQQIFADCTMEGEAHEQLHHYLIPLGKQLDVLEKGEGDARKAALETVAKHLEHYDEKFE